MVPFVTEKRSMPVVANDTLDVVEEFRMRRWARENFVPAADRDADWHPVILDEMHCKELELREAGRTHSAAGSLVPLVPGGFRVLHGAHSETAKSQVLLSVPAVLS